MSFEEKIEKLQQQIDEASGKLNDKKKMPLPVLLAIAVPIVIFLALIIIAPGFVRKKQGNKYVRCAKKLFQWTLIFTVLVWMGLYLYMYCAYSE